MHCFAAENDYDAGETGQRNGNLRGALLKSTILHYHDQGIRVLLTICQQSTGPSLFDPAPLNDVAQGRADAVQCGNEEMKYDPPFTRYIQPADFARYFDLCVRAMHAKSDQYLTLV